MAHEIERFRCIQYVGNRTLAVTNVGEFRRGEVRLIGPQHQAEAEKLIKRSRGVFVRTGKAPGVYEIAPAPQTAKRSRK